MARLPNEVPTTKCHPTISVRTESLLEQLVPMGIYGHSKNEIAARFIEQALQTLVERPQLKVPSDGSASTAAVQPPTPSVRRKPAHRVPGRRSGRS
jgi:hypothetical protein